MARKHTAETAAAPYPRLGSNGNGSGDGHWAAREAQRAMVAEEIRAALADLPPRPPARPTFAAYFGGLVAVGLTIFGAVYAMDRRIGTLETSQAVTSTKLDQVVKSTERLEQHFGTKPVEEAAGRSH